MDETKLNEFIAQLLNELSGAFGIAPVRIGKRLGLYQAMWECGPLTLSELAEVTHLSERYVREWLLHQAALNHVTYEPETERFTLHSEHVAFLVNQPETKTVFSNGRGAGRDQQAGDGRLRDVVESGDLRTFRRAAETLLNLNLEART